MKIINYNPKELGEWRVHQQDGELVREHQSNQKHDRAKKFADIILGFNTLTILITVCFCCVAETWQKLFTILIAVDIGLCFLSLGARIVASYLEPTEALETEEQRAFYKWFHERASRYKVLSVRKISSIGVTRLEIAFEKDDQTVLRCISPAVSVVETTNRSEDALDVSAGILYVACQESPVTFEDETLESTNEVSEHGET